MTQDPEAKASRLGKAWGETASRGTETATDQASRARFLARISHSNNTLYALGDAPRPLRHARPWIAIGAAAVAAAAALAWGATRYGDRDAVRAEPEVALDELRAPKDEALHTRLADGSRLELGARGVVRHSPEHADHPLYLDRGSLKAEFRGTRTVRVASYAVTTTDARHRYDWDPEVGRFELHVDAGEARVSGRDGTVLVVRPGQSLRANTALGTHTVQSSDSEPRLFAPATSTTPTDISPETEEGGQPTPGSTLVKPLGNLDLHELVARGEFEAAMTRAREGGIARCLSSCTDRDLRALADAARYTQNRGVALQALEALAGRPQAAATAAFLLGRHHENGRPAEALRWFERSLQRAPRGAHAAEALGGKMRALENLGRTNDAAHAAALYLKRHPNGVEAARARLLVEAEETSTTSRQSEDR